MLLSGWLRWSGFVREVESWQCLLQPGLERSRPGGEAGPVAVEQDGEGARTGGREDARTRSQVSRAQCSPRSSFAVAAQLMSSS
jgi:hypothetical protein